MYGAGKTTSDMLDMSSVGQKEKDNEVSHMQMVSEIPLNVVFLSIGHKIKKFDLVTKELKFEFSSYARKNMQLYDFDDKLIVSDHKNVRLWDFFDHKEEVPELVTVLESPIKIEVLKVNKFAEKNGERKDIFYYIIACQTDFKVYHGRLDLLLKGEIDDSMDKIRSVEYALDMKYLYVGTEKGNIYRYELPSPQEVEEEYERGDLDEAPKAKRSSEPFKKPVRCEDKKDADYAVAMMHRVVGILEMDFVVMHIAGSGLKVFTWNYDTDTYTVTKVELPEYKGEIDYIKATPDG